MGLREPRNGPCGLWRNRSYLSHFAWLDPARRHQSNLGSKRRDTLKVRLADPRRRRHGSCGRQRVTRVARPSRVTPVAREARKARNVQIERGGYNKRTSRMSRNMRITCERAGCDQLEAPTQRKCKHPVGDLLPSSSVMARARPQTQLSLAWSDADATAATEVAGRRTDIPDGHSAAARRASGHTTGDDHIVLTVAEVARTLNIGRRQAWEMIWRGDLPIVRLGPRTIRVARSVLEEYVVVKSRPYGS